MNAAELLDRMIKYGADEAGIRDRFGNNAELYQICLMDFIEESNFAVLAEAMEARDYERAFDAAHALKGLSGNLGILAVYDAISALVESLRGGRYENIEAEYALVVRQMDELTAAISSESAQLSPAAQAAQKPENGTTPANDLEGDKTEKKIDGYMVAAIIAILGAMLLVGYLFTKVNIDYRENVLEESGGHLIEMSNQIKLYIEERIAIDWKIALNVCDNIASGKYENDDEAIFDMLQRKQQVWGVSDLMLYTENGYCIYASGDNEMNDVASDTVDKAQSLGKYLSIIDTKLIYTVPIKTELRFAGSRIVAVSVVQEMESFLEDMQFSSFDEEAWMYLTEENGIVISMLTNENSVVTFNFSAIVKNSKLTPLGEGYSSEDYLSTNSAAVFLMAGESEKSYVVSLPVYTGDTPLRLFYLAPEAVVNSAMQGFSRQLIAYSLIIIALFVVLAFLVFLLMYRNRKQLFDEAIMARDRMFDLLVKNTENAFALFHANENVPSYISTNASGVIVDKYWTIHKTETGYELRNDTNTQTSTLKQANEMLQGWDGKAPFRSGYIKSERTVPQKYFEYQLYPVDSDGTDFVGIAQDVTHAYAREEAARNAIEMATRANEAKSRFLSNMSHDIRTPMNAIINMTNFAQESIDQPKKLGQYLHTIHESADHLLQLINDVLDMSRIESGQTVIASATFDIRTEIQRQVDMIRPLCEAKEQTLITDFDGLNDTAVCGDALKLSQIIMNLLSNAVKFTPQKGAVRFTALELPSLRDDTVNVRFSIEDTGIGISNEYLEHIYEPFSRSNDKNVNRIEGTGLGLSICKSYVDAMGGTLRCESEEGEGSIFTVELFFKKTSSTTDAEATQRYSPDASMFLGMHCLVVEDNATNQLIAKTLLGRLGFMVDIADNGSDGVKKFLAAPQDKYDVIYMDIRMPALDGYQATAKIRESEHPRARSIPIIAMTANVFAEDIEKARAAGMDGFLGKPIVSFDIIEQTSKAIKIKRGQIS